MTTLEKLIKELNETPIWVKSQDLILDSYKGQLSKKEKEIESINQRGYEFEKPNK